jgi:hypothetical protein
MNYSRPLCCIQIHGKILYKWKESKENDDKFISELLTLCPDLKELSDEGQSILLEVVSIKCY